MQLSPWRWGVLSVVTSLLIVLATTTVFAAITSAGAIKITSITPSTFNPASGQTTTIAYSLPAPCNYQIVVHNSAGTQIRSIVNFIDVSPGSYSRVWDGKESNGLVAPAGVYTVVITGSTSSGAKPLTSATAPVTVAGTTVTPPATPPVSNGSDLGQLVEGCGRANFDWFKNSGVKFDVAFHAVKTGTITSLAVPWRTTTDGYGSGTFGVFTWQVQTNGANNMPSGTIIASASGLHPTTQMVNGANDAPFILPITVQVTAGQVYHIVMFNTDPNYSVNWSSINTVMSRVVSWDPATSPDARGAAYNGGSWQPWSSNSDVWNSGGGNTKNGAHIGLVVGWSDGSYTGDPYWSASMGSPLTITGSQCGGEVMVWNRASATISKIGIPVKGSGTLVYHLTQVGKGDLATGTIINNANVGSIPQWYYATLPKPVTLQQGVTYDLWFQATSGSFTQNPVYGPSSPASWYNVSWGGPQSCVISGSNGNWSTASTEDLAFCLK